MKSPRKKARKTSASDSVVVNPATTSTPELDSRFLATEMSSQFLELPLEIRLLIYKEVFEGVGITITPLYKQGHYIDGIFRNEHFGTGLLSSCKTIREEAMPVLTRAFDSLKLTDKMNGSMTSGSCVARIPMGLLKRIKIVELQYLSWDVLGLQAFESLAVARFEPRIYHFQERDRPDNDEDSIKGGFGQVRFKRDYNVSLWSFAVHDRSEVDLDITAWFFNTQRNLSKGWKIRFQGATGQVLDIKEARFTKKPLTKLQLGEAAGGNKNIERIVRKSWKYNWESWNMELLNDESLSEGPSEK